MCMLLAAPAVRAEDATALFYSLRTKVLTVKDYTADVKVKIDINHMKIPQMKGILYFKNPDKMRLERNGGLSLLPKKNINLTLSNLIPAGQVTVIDAGTAVIAGRKTHIIKVIPEDAMSNIVLAKIWVDEANMLALRTETTTRNDGTVIMDLEFGNYMRYSLPDKVTIHMDVKDFKMPKGLTMDYNDVPEAVQKTGEIKSGKGTISISYLKYAVNTGLSDDVFKSK